MSDRVARVVRARPTRSIGSGVILAVFVAAAVVVLTGSLNSSRAARAAGVGVSQPAISANVNHLLDEMTVAEKFGQLEMSGPTGTGGAPGEVLLKEAREGQVGSVLDMVGVANINELQKAALQSRLHIPIIAALDVIHGYKTMFPVPIAEASSWDPALVENDESVSADEATADGLKWTFNPMVDIARDPRWGRVVEGAGEDPYLGSAIAAWGPLLA